MDYRIGLGVILICICMVAILYGFLENERRLIFLGIIGTIATQCVMYFVVTKSPLMYQELDRFDVDQVRYFLLEYEYGELGTKAMLTDDGKIIVLTCFRPEGNDETNCWDKTFERAE